MSRPRQFDCECALDRAMQVFWRKGYEATSIQDLVEATGVNRASLYGTYGGKRQLFEKALARFRGAVPDGLPPGLAGIRAFFRNVAEQTLADPRGCLLLNSVTELAAEDPDIRRLGESARRQLEQFFISRLAQAAESGQIRADRDVPAVARFLTNTVFGLRTTAKTAPDRQVVEDIVSTALSALE